MKKPDRQAVTIEEVLEHIAIRLVTLGNKTRSERNTYADRLRAAHGIRELVKIDKWIKVRMDKKG